MKWLHKFVRALFSRRKEGRNDLMEYPNWRVGISLAASWSWGLSIVLGMSIMHTKGVIPFGAWLTGNLLALPLFGAVYRYLPFFKQWCNFLPLILFFLFVEFFAIILNLQGMLTGLGGGVDVVSFAFVPKPYATYLVMAIGVFIIWYINRGGLKFSFLTDTWQYGVQLGGVVLLALLSASLGGMNSEITMVKGDGLEWAFLGFVGIIVGALATSHQWQRFTAIKEENVLRASLWGGFFFAIYMAFVGLTALFFVEHILLGSIFLIILLTLASSSIDSAVAGLEFVAQRLRVKPYWATLFALATILAWPRLIEMGMTNIWSFMAEIRLYLVLGLIALSLVMLHRQIGEKIELFLVKTKLLNK